MINISLTEDQFAQLKALGIVSTVQKDTAGTEIFEAAIKAVGNAEHPICGDATNESISLKLFAKEVAELAQKQGKYDNKPDLPSLLMHVISELTEATSAWLCKQFADPKIVQFAKENVNSPMFKEFFQTNIKSKFADEVADAILILFSIAGYYKIDIVTHLLLKHHYNAIRNEHSIFNNYNDN